MKTKTNYKIETVPKTDCTFEPTRCVALIREAKSGDLAGSIYRSFRNAPGAEPGLPTWWFCPAEPAIPVVRSDESEADIVRQALEWLEANA